MGCYHCSVALATQQPGTLSEGLCHICVPIIACCALQFGRHSVFVHLSGFIRPTGGRVKQTL
eukprot:365103-Chlamydomonas_euryale.AAC.7